MLSVCMYSIGWRVYENSPKLVKQINTKHAHLIIEPIIIENALQLRKTPIGFSWGTIWTWKYYDSKIRLQKPILRFSEGYHIAKPQCIRINLPNGLQKQFVVQICQMIGIHILQFCRRVGLRLSHMNFCIQFFMRLTI